MDDEIKRKSEHYVELFNKNFNQLKDFYSHDFIVFCELNFLKNEILSCLLFELYQSSICTSNHFLERMIKLSLIKLHTNKYNYTHIAGYTEKLNESEKQYDSLVLNESLKKALEKELITTDQHTYLINAKNDFRNPYSHAQISKVIKNDNNFRGFMFSFDDVKNKMKEGKPLDIPNATVIPKFSPPIAQVLQETNAKTFAFEYFKNLFEILIEIEKKITGLRDEKH